MTAARRRRRAAAAQERPLAQLTCHELTVQASRARPWEVDGEVAGTTVQLRVTLELGSRLVRVPARKDW